jgi:hypothetical protein
MLNRKLRNLAVTGITIASATGLTALSAHGVAAATTAAAGPGHAVGAAITVRSTTAAPAATGIQGFYLGNWESVLSIGGNTGCLFAHAHNYPIQTTNNPSDCAQWWSYINRENIINLSGQTETAWEIQLEDTGQCINDVDFIEYLDSCQPGDENELFWQTPASGAGLLFTYANVIYSDVVGAYVYMSAPYDIIGTVSDDPSPDPFALAQWARTCAVNC